MQQKTTALRRPKPSFRATKRTGLFIKHQTMCPAAFADGPRCRCQPSYRGRRRNLITGKPEWSPTSRDRSEILAWLAAKDGGEEVKERIAAGRTFGSLGDEWLHGVLTGVIGKRNGKRGPYSPNTLKGYQRDWENFLRPGFGERPADDIDEFEWQRYVDDLSRDGLSRSRISNMLAVASAIYGWASRPTRRLAKRNPIRLIEKPPADENPRDRVALTEEALQLLDALCAEDQVPFALAFFAGIRREEIYRLTWGDVELDGYRITIQKAKSEAGTNRRIPIAEPIRALLLRAYLRAGRPGPEAKVSPVSVMSGKFYKRVDKAWEEADKQKARALGRRLRAGERLEPIRLHECRHTYASWLMAAGYSPTEIQTFMGHADLQMVARYAKMIPQPDTENPAERLNQWLEKTGNLGAL